MSFSQRQHAFWRRENCFHEAQPKKQRARDARDGALADDHSSDSDDAPTGVEESAAPAAPVVVAVAPKRAAMSLRERLQAIRIKYGSTPS